MHEYKEKFDLGEKPKISPQYKRLSDKAYKLKLKYAKSWDTLTLEYKRKQAKLYKNLTIEKLSVSLNIPRDQNYKRMQYIRYADDFIIGVIGSKEDSMKLKDDIKAFLAEKLKLTLSVEKTKITHTSNFARFLSYDITVSRSQAIKKDKNGIRKRVYSNKIKLYVPHEKWFSKLKEYNAIKISKDEKGKVRYKATHRSKLINKPDVGILQTHNAEIRGLYNYYCIANNASVIGKFGRLMYWSMCKTFAGKYRTKVKKIKNKYVKNKDFTVQYDTKAGVKEQVFYNQGYGRKEKLTFKDLNVLPSYKKYANTNSLAKRIKSKCCELCGKTDEAIEIHQVKKLNDITGHTEWEIIMRKRRRKTLAVCNTCHQLIHKSETVKI
jgi:hypothetical protein